MTAGEDRRPIAYLSPCIAFDFLRFNLVLPWLTMGHGDSLTLPEKPSSSHEPALHSQYREQSPACRNSANRSCWGYGGAARPGSEQAAEQLSRQRSKQISRDPRDIRGRSPTGDSKRRIWREAEGLRSLPHKMSIIPQSVPAGQPGLVFALKDHLTRPEGVLC